MQNRQNINQNPSTPTKTNNQMSHYRSGDNIVIVDSDTEAETETDTESDYDDDLVGTFYEIYEDEFVNRPVNECKQPGKYFIGNYSVHNTTLLLESTIKPNNFFRFPSDVVNDYLYHMSLTQNCIPKIEVLQLCVEQRNQWIVYTVVVKTFWIRLIQRKWRKIYEQRQSILRKRQSINAIGYREISGKWPAELYVLPGILGMLV